ncbi:MAG: hypothetical protein IPL78_05730 [Chloroflexi bacterium]|nr:hypothetical protein [Chloroflexota bacterium]
MWSLVFILLLAGAGGCTAVPKSEALPTAAATALLPPPPPPPPHASALPTLLPTATPQPAPLITPTTAPWSVSAAANLPPSLRAAATQLTTAHPDRFRWADTTTPTDLHLTIAAPGQPVAYPIATWLYAVAAPSTATPTA